MDYTLHQLNIFLKVVNNESITKASEELYLTQPAVSIQLKKFQDQFSVPLTEVIGRKLYVTDFGMEIAEVAKDILEKVDEINYKTQTFKNQLAGKLKLSVVSTGKYVMPYFLSGFINHNTGVELAMDVTNKSSVINSLIRNEVDFALMSVLPDNINTESIALTPNHLCLIANKNTVIEKDPSELFSKKALIYREEGSATRNAMEEFINTISISSRKKIELTSNEAVKQAVVAGLGLSIMPLIGLKSELKNHEVKIIPTTGLPITTSWYIVWLKNKQHSPVSEAFKTYIRKNKESIASKQFGWVNEYL